MSNKKIVPHLWFDTQAVEAADFYVSTFGEGSKVTNKYKLHNTPSGDVDTVSFNLLGIDFMAISAGPFFKFNPSISFIVGCETKEEVNRLWEKLSEGGKTLMPLDKYPFSERFGWIQDKFGLSWQLIFTHPEGDQRPRIVPALLFTNEVSGKADEAIRFYLSVFKDSKMGSKMTYGPDQKPEKEGNIMFADFQLFDTWMAAMDSSLDHKFNFGEAISFILNCDTQEEIDYYWEKLSFVPESEQCGWLKDKYGISWQIIPKILDEMLEKGSKEQAERVTQAFLKMKKFDIKKLKKAYTK